MQIAKLLEKVDNLSLEDRSVCHWRKVFCVHAFSHPQTPEHTQLHYARQLSFSCNLHQQSLW